MKEPRYLRGRGGQRSLHRKRRGSPGLAAGVALSAVVALTAGGSAMAATPASAGVTTVTVGIGPFLDNQTLPLAQQLGFAKQEGINFKFETLASNQAIFEAIESGTLDMGAGTMRGLVPLAKTAPNLRNFIIRDQFLGNYIVGRKNPTQPTYAGLVASGDSPSQARLKVLTSMMGKSIDIIAVQNLPPVTSALEEVGLKPSGLHVNNFSDDSEASLAFEHGSGNFYTGNLVTQAELLVDHPNEYVDLGGGPSLLGPAGLSYDAWTSSSGWLASNHQTALKVLAVMLKVQRYMAQDLGSAAAALTTLTNTAASSTLSVPVVEQLVKNYELFLDASDMKENVFNPSSSLYWQNEIKLDEKANQSALPSGYNPDVTNPAQAFFQQYLTDPALVKFVNGPLP
jgi:hypothetical protein